MLQKRELSTEGYKPAWLKEVLLIQLPGEHIPSASSALCLQITSPVIASLLGPKRIKGKKSICSSIVKSIFFKAISK